MGHTRVSHQMLKDSRIPVSANLTLEVSATGDDATGGLDSPFRQPQAAINWAIANLDFKCVGRLTISLGAGSFEGVAFDKTIYGLRELFIGGVAGTNIKFVHSISPTIIHLSNLSFDGTSEQHIEANTGSLIVISGDITLGGNPTGNTRGIHAFCGSKIISDGVRITANGTLRGVLNANLQSTMLLTNANLVINATMAAGLGIINMNNQSHITFANPTWSGNSPSIRHTATVYSAIIGANVSAMPGTSTGNVNTNSIVA